MALKNNLNITDQVELAKVEEKISKQKAKQLFDSGTVGFIEFTRNQGLISIILAN